MEANEDTCSRTLTKFFTERQMKNAILEKHKHLSPPATQNRNKKCEPIDAIWVSMSVKPNAAGFLALDDACPSDHMALWIDL